MAAWVTLICLSLFVLAYRTYARWIGRRVYADDEAIETPAHTRRDDRDYVPTSRGVLFGHHFTSIAGAAPIIGPCVAVYWGWLPALVWIVIGTIFMGAVHDFGALVASVKHDGRSVGEIAKSTMGPRARALFLCFVLLLVWLVLAVFAMAIAGLFVSQPSSVLPINIEIVVAVAMGYLLTKCRMRAFWPSIAALVVLYAFVWVGVRVPLSLQSLGIDQGASVRVWVVALLAYAAVSSLLPVWLLLQPRDYINSHQLMVGLALLFVGLFVSHPSFDAPAIRDETAGAPSMFPMLLVTVACGAISGFHGLVSSGTSSKQLDRLADARAVGYGAMLGEGTLAVASVMAAAAGIGLVQTCHLPAQGDVDHLSWATYYDSWASAGANKASAFVLGGGAFLEAVGVPADLARTVMAVLVISFAATTLDTATRIQRFVVAELGVAIRAPVLERPIVGVLVATLPAAALALVDVRDPGSGTVTQAGWVLWPIFGASNQMLAALTLVVLSLYVMRQNRPSLPLVVPMIFITAVTLVALSERALAFFEQGNRVLGGVAVGLLALVVWMLAEGVAALRRTLRDRRSASAS